MALLLLGANAHSQNAIVIIDDLGYNLMIGTAVAELPFPVTLAIIPFSPHAQQIAEIAKSRGKDVIIHSPMTSIDDKKLDAGGLHSHMGEKEFVDTLNLQLANLPQAIGLNNHMGSQLTQQPLAMTWLMQRLKQKQLFFIDSRTTPESIALKTALNNQVTAWQRDVFLDHHRDKVAIEQQLQNLAQKSKRQGLAIAIGHPYAETLEVLTSQWHWVEAQGVSFILPSLITKQKLLAQKVSENHTISQ